MKAIGAEDAALQLVQYVLQSIRIIHSIALQFCKRAQVTNCKHNSLSLFLNFARYKSEEQLHLIQELIDKDLSEPYSIFTYRYFINQWPHLCYLAMEGSDCIGTVVSKLVRF